MCITRRYGTEGASSPVLPPSSSSIHSWSSVYFFTNTASRISIHAGTVRSPRAIQGCLVVNVLLAPARHICGVGAANLRATGSSLATEAIFVRTRGYEWTVQAVEAICQLNTKIFVSTESVTSATEMSPQFVGGRYYRLSLGYARNDVRSICRVSTRLTATII